VNKKLLVILFAVGVLVFGAVLFFVMKGKNSAGTGEEIVKEVPFADRPVVSLTPSEDGHWLKLIIDKIQIAKAESLDYELLYSLPDGRTQGVPGSVKIETKSIERDLLLGSESSGKFRYDEGVKDGTLTIRFRDAKGKLLAKFSTKFSLLQDTDKLVSVEGDFEYVLEKESKDWFVVMQTFGLPDEKDASQEIISGPYGVFSSETIPQGEASGWQEFSPGIFYK